MPTHAEKRLLPYEPEQLFALVADVERYPDFLPWCLAARVTRRQDNVIHADLIIGFKMFREGFTSRVTLDRPASRIDVAYTRGPFRYLNNHWIFDSHPEGCLIDFYVDFEFRSRLLRRAMAPLFNEAVGRMVAAFEARAEDLYRGGPAASVAG
ncbi:MAG: type II toxin-antitoxin system RatA family toxin [Kiloniellales bacterium]|nr:type II toxin-antitoxin system RatA family toxin [Kiloniellales bacterium]